MSASPETPEGATTFPPTDSLPTEWTRARLTATYAGVFLAFAVACVALWAMRQPLLTASVGNTALGEGQQVLNADGTTTTVAASGSISMWEAINMDQYLASQGASPELMNMEPVPGVPVIEPMLGFPAPTTWLLIAVAMFAGGFFFRNTALFIFGILPLQKVSAAMDDLLAALTHGGHPSMFTELPAAMVQSRATTAAWFLAVAGGAFILLVNRKQRALEKRQFEAGLRATPSRMTTIHMVASVLVRGQLEKANAAASQVSSGTKTQA